ncbi:hypothetical protein [Streptomyces sp. NPDC050848]|uniref:hypothetical protein n=1 Tax=Streptomyces sp. NPDC050848 TaxID=3155791 RepID=UPI003406F0B6
MYLDIGPSRHAHDEHMVLRLRKLYWSPNMLVGSGTLYTATAFMSWMSHGVELTPWIPSADHEHAA